MKLNKETEEKLKAEVLKHLEKGKESWDIPHTLACVYWMRKLIEKEGGDERILVTAMYLHDIGYPEMKGDYGYDEVMGNEKNKHAEIGAEESEKILRELDFSEDEIKEIVYLVRKHDDLDDIDSKNRQLVMEADSLAQIDWERVTPSFSKEDSLRYLNEHFKPKRIPRFKTETGKKFLKELLEKTENYWD
jgi:putative nucleotidyltransferase with HDIG domain